MIFATLILSGLAAVAAAKKAAAPPVFTKTLVSECMTASGAKSVATLATLTKAVQLTTTITSMSTSTPTVTRTLDAVVEETVEWSTSTITETASQVTDTLVVTSTDFETDTEWESSTAFETEWSTITEYSTTTPTIQPSAGYTPIYSMISDMGKTPAKRDAALVARADKNSMSISDGEIILPPAQYPVRVQCINVIYIVYTKVKVATGTKTFTSTASAQTTLSTRTYTIKTTTTEAVQDAITTSVVSETSTISLTSTSWETSTVTSSTTTTSLVPAATPYYAACSDDNLLSSVSGSGISRIALTPQQSFIAAGSASSAYDCCVAAIDGGYAGSVYRPMDTMCYVVSTANGVCDATAKGFGLYAARGQTPSGGFVVSNGNCGSGRLMSK